MTAKRIAAVGAVLLVGCFVSSAQQRSQSGEQASAQSMTTPEAQAPQRGGGQQRQQATSGEQSSALSVGQGRRSASSGTSG